MKNSIYLVTMDITLSGGVERVVSNMANEFTKKFDEVHIVSVFQCNKSVKYTLDPEVSIVYLHKNRSYDDWIQKFDISFVLRRGLINRILASFSMTDALYSYIKKTKTKEKAIVFYNGYGFLPYKKNKDSLSIGLDHSNFPFTKPIGLLNYYKSKIGSFFTRNLDIISCLTDSELNEWQSLGKPTYVMPNFIPNIPNVIPKYDTRKKILLSMGRMDTDQKGFDRLITAYSKIAYKHPDWQVNIYGEGHLKSYYQKMIDNFDMNEFIKIFDYTKHPDEKYLESSIFVICSRTEGFSMVLCEAMSCGMIPVSYWNTGSNTIISSHKYGYLIENNDAITLNDTLEQLMDKSLVEMESISTNARESIINRFSSEIVINKWIEIINKHLD